jgi:hypothetical protein
MWNVWMACDELLRDFFYILYNEQLAIIALLCVLPDYISTILLHEFQQALQNKLN